MSFKKNGSDPISTRPNVVSMGGLNWVVNAAMELLGFDLDALLGRSKAMFYDGFRYQRSGRGRGKVTPPRQRSNMLHVSRRVRRKHRRASRAA